MADGMAAAKIADPERAVEIVGEADVLQELELIAEADDLHVWVILDRGPDRVRGRSQPQLYSQQRLVTLEGTDVGDHRQAGEDCPLARL